MFDYFREKGIPENKLISVSMPVANEIRYTFGKLPKIDVWYQIYARIFDEGLLSGYIFGASEVVAENACDYYNIKKDFIWRYINKVNVCKCVIQELFGDTVHAQQHRDMLAEQTIGEDRTELYLEGLKYGAADAREMLLGGERTHYLKQALNILDYEEISPNEPLYSMIEFLKENPLSSLT